MHKIVFNNFPKTRQPFPFEKFDNEIELSELKLSSLIYHDNGSHFFSLGINLKGVHIPIAEINLFHSGTLLNFEDTFVSAEILVDEIVNRFYSFIPKGQQCLKFT